LFFLILKVYIFILFDFLLLKLIEASKFLTTIKFFRPGLFFLTKLPITLSFFTNLDENSHEGPSSDGELEFVTVLKYYLQSGSEN